MKCRRAKTLIFDFIDGQISDSDRVALERHLGQCQTCDAEASGLRKSLDLLHRAPQVQPDENFNWKVRLAIAKERDAAARRTSAPHVWVAAWNTRFATSAVAAFAMVVTAGYFTLRSFDAPVSENAPAMASSANPTKAPAPTPIVDSARFRAPVSEGPTLVSTAPQQSNNDGPAGLIDSFDADSLAHHFAQSEALRMRTRQLEDQVKLLMNELNACEKDCQPR